MSAVLSILIKIVLALAITRLQLICNQGIRRGWARYASSHLCQAAEPVHSLKMNNVPLIVNGGQ